MLTLLITMTSNKTHTNISEIRREVKTTATTATKCHESLALWAFIMVAVDFFTATGTATTATVLEKICAVIAVLFCILFLRFERYGIILKIGVAVLTGRDLRECRSEMVGE